MITQLGLIPLAIILGAIGGLIVIEPDISAAVTVSSWAVCCSSWQVAN